VKLDRVEASAYTIPTDQPEADGTFHWDKTTMVLVEAVAESGERGLGFSYAADAAAGLVQEILGSRLEGCPIDDVRAAWETMLRAVRNVGRPGIAATAISAVDIALWDLRARILEMPLFKLLGVRRTQVPIYGSGGFTTYTVDKLQSQLRGWVEQGIPRVKMKLGTDWGTKGDEDVRRVKAAREAIGDSVALYVDANGAYKPKQAVAMANRFYEHGVAYFEEPVSSDHLEELAFVRQRSPMDIAAGEYGYDLPYFRRMLEAGAVDVLQADASRCAGITGFLQVAALCSARGLPLSAHCAPSLHVHPCCAAPPLRHLEYFHDHVRIEHMLFDGALNPVDGALHPDLSRPGLGLDFKRADAERYVVWRSTI
jgi:L-alanine-DL-glutamate epimerase-like enolase superfamily enzyme